jgi:hypothetical protein
MKKLVLSYALISISTSLFAQEAADKKVQAGLVLGAGINFQKMETKLMDKNGAGNDLTIGANVNFSLTETIGLNTGIEFDFETIKYKAGANNPVYYRYNDATIEAKEEGTANQMYLLSSRKQKATYITIPVMMIFRTNFIGYFRYFGKFGLRNSFLLSNKINDEGFNYPNDVNPVIESGSIVAGSNENMSAKNEMLFFKSAVGLSGGAEWNFTGSTSLVGEIGYYYGITPLHVNRKEEKSYLYTTDEFGANPQYFNNSAKQGQLMLKVSILF